MRIVSHSLTRRNVIGTSDKQSFACEPVPTTHNLNVSEQLNLSNFNYFEAVKYHEIRNSTSMSFRDIHAYITNDIFNYTFQFRVHTFRDGRYLFQFFISNGR